MSDLVEFRHLKYIVAVAEAANITKASERLFLAQPSLSKQIKDLEEEIGFPIFLRRREGVCITPAGQMVIAYAQEDVLRYQRGSKELELTRGSYAEVIAIDAKSNAITVKRDIGGTVSYDPARVRGIDAYREMEKSFAVEDRLQMTAPYRDMDIPNRALGTVERIASDELTVRMDSGKTVTFDPHEMRHFDHGYAVTSHSSQGLTAERVLVNMDTEMHSTLINARFAYVSISRGSHEAQIFTDNAASLGDRLDHDASKTSAMIFTKEEKPKLGPSQNQSLIKQGEVGVQLQM